MTISITFRTDNTADWGVGKGAALTPAEVDQNFWNIVQYVLNLEAGITPVEISNFSVTGSQLTVIMANGDEYGPFTLPSANLSLEVATLPLTTAGTYTLTQGDALKWLRATAASSAVTIPSNATEAIPVGTEFTLVHIGGPISIDSEAGVTANLRADAASGTGHIAETNFIGAVVKVKKVAADEWDLTGDLATTV